jgi:hypothetical protein
MFAALLLGLTGNALADDPSGNWKFSATLGKKSAEVTLKLKLEGEKLTGSITAAQGNRELPLSDGTFKDDKVSFSVTIERGDQKLTQKYSGTLSGDTIKGKIDSERGGKSRSADWEAKRVK